MSKSDVETNADQVLALPLNLRGSNGKSANLRAITLSRDRFPTNTTTYRHPVHRWFNFIAGFSPEFVSKCCNGISSSTSCTLLDPFAGCGTALVRGAEHGLRTIGYEPHPIFARIARAKLPGPSAIEHLRVVDRILSRGLNAPAPLSTLSEDAGRFLKKLFPPSHLTSLLGAREALRRSACSDSDLAFLVLTKVLEGSSHSQTDGIYKAPTSRREAVQPLEALRAVLATIREDLEHPQSSTLGRLAKVHASSSQRMASVPSESVDVIVTSPPYLNNFDYAEMTRMHLYFWGLAGSWGEITDLVRSRLIVNTTTALRGHKDKQAEYRLNIPDVVRSRLARLVVALAEQRAVRPGKKEYDYLVYPYFSQVADVMRECHRVLKPGARMHVMIADAAFYGIHVASPQLLADVLKALGFVDVSCSLVRRRGHRWILAKRDGSPIGLGEYHVQAQR